MGHQSSSHMGICVHPLFFCEKKPTTSIAARSFVLLLLLLKAFSFSEGFAHERLRRLWGWKGGSCASIESRRTKYFPFVACFCNGQIASKCGFECTFLSSSSSSSTSSSKSLCSHRNSLCRPPCLLVFEAVWLCAPWNFLYKKFFFFHFFYCYCSLYSTLTSFPIQLELPFSTPSSFFSSQWW